MIGQRTTGEGVDVQALLMGFDVEADIAWAALTIRSRRLTKRDRYITITVGDVEITGYLTWHCIKIGFAPHAFPEPDLLQRLTRLQGQRYSRRRASRDVLPAHSSRADTLGAFRLFLV
ncbi:hypothetical protein SAMN03159290_02643 [Pseudomonas sp. NFACC13-1]|nr:hypothetical protein SAMN03159290_02643 [Pseudomonas sp. NFACC13-1]